MLRGCCFLALSILLVGASASTAAADQVPQLSVNARALHANGGGDNGTRSPHPMVTGTGVTTYLFATESLCGLGGAEVTAENLEDMLRRKMHVWKVSRTGISHANGKLTFDLEWTRFDNGSGIPAASGKQRLTLAEGATYPIDMIRAATPGPCKTSAIVVEVEAGTIEAPAFADTVLQYDLWLTHESGSGKKESRHFVVSAKHGTPVPFELAPFRFDIPKLVPNQFDIDLVTRVSGMIRGRLRDDGKVTVELETRKSDRLEKAGDAAPTASKGSGRKVLELPLGETVDIEFPTASGFVARLASPDAQAVKGRVSVAPGVSAPPGPAVSLKDGMLVVNFRDFFADDRFSVMIRVRKAE